MANKLLFCGRHVVLVCGLYRIVPNAAKYGFLCASSAPKWTNNTRQLNKCVVLQVIVRFGLFLSHGGSRRGNLTPFDPPREGNRSSSGGFECLGAGVALKRLRCLLVAPQFLWHECQCQMHAARNFGCYAAGDSSRSRLFFFTCG